MQKTDLHWLAGLLEGEGSFNLPSSSPTISIQMTDKAPIQKAAQLFGGRTVSNHFPKDKSRKRVFSTGLSGAVKVHALLKELYPLMSPRRQSRIGELLTRCVEIIEAQANRIQKAILTKYLFETQQFSRRQLSNLTGQKYSTLCETLRLNKRYIGRGRVHG